MDTKPSLRCTGSDPEKALGHFSPSDETCPSQDKPPVSNKELFGWYGISWAVEPYSVVVSAVFLPLVLDSLAKQAGYQPDHVTPCDLEGASENCVVPFGASWINTTSLPLYCSAISVILQAFVFVGFSSLADHGDWRKTFLIFFNVVGALSTICFFTIHKAELYQIAATLTIVSNLCFGAVHVFFYAYLHTLTEYHPEVMEASQQGSEGHYRQVKERVSNAISGHCFAIGTIVSVSVLFVKNNLKATNMQLIAAAFIVPFSSIVGNYIFLLIQRRCHMSTRNMIILIGILYIVLPVYGILGFFTPIGLRHIPEIYAVAVYHGLMFGAVQSFCRVLFCELLPPGHENEFFGLYEITDKGSSWIGPLVSAAISDLTGELRHAFYFLLVMLVIPVFILFFIDVEKGKREAQAFAARQKKIVANSEYGGKVHVFESLTLLPTPPPGIVPQFEKNEANV
ncbi:Autophagy protein 22 [Dispira simplex]|nr:Autophagy protein 22 [Dispira simplex]